MQVPDWMNSLGLEDPTVDEYMQRPDLRQICAFCIGWLLAASVFYLLHSPTTAAIFHKLSKLLTRRSRHIISIEDADSLNIITKETVYSLGSNPDPLALVFIFDLLILSTSLSMFGSLLAFPVPGNDTLCTFLVAWSSLATQSTRLVGIMKLTVHLKESGASKWEYFSLWAALLCASILLFLTTAVSVGTLRVIPIMPNFALCYRKHFTLTAGVTSGMNLLMELYIFARLITSLWPWFSVPKGLYRVLLDIRILRVFSLLLLDASTLYPNLMPTSLIADFVPLVVFSILALIAFNYPAIPSRSLASSFSIAPTLSRSQSMRHVIPTPSISPFIFVPSFKPSSPPPAQNLASYSGNAHTDNTLHPPKFVHPFAADSLRNATPLSFENWPTQSGSSMNTDHESLQNAVVTTAAKRWVGQKNVTAVSHPLIPLKPTSAMAPVEHSAQSNRKRHSASPPVINFANTPHQRTLLPRLVMPSSSQNLYTSTSKASRMRSPKAHQARQLSPDEGSDQISRNSALSSANSAIVYGSDIVFNSSKHDVMRNRHKSPLSPLRRESFTSSSYAGFPGRRRSEDSRTINPSTTGHGDFLSGPVSDEGLSVVPEAESSNNSTLNADRRALNRPTFGEIGFAEFKDGLARNIPITSPQAVSRSEGIAGRAITPEEGSPPWAVTHSALH